MATWVPFPGLLLRLAEIERASPIMIKNLGQLTEPRIHALRDDAAFVHHVGDITIRARDVDVES